jgi:integrase
MTEALPPRYRLMLLLAAWCAMRYGELTELRRKDIDLTNGVVRIRRAVVRVNGEFIVGTPKTDAGTRDVAIPPHLMPEVRQHLHQHTKSGREALLFPARHGEHRAPASLYKVWYPARSAAGRPNLRWHDLRHT